MKYQVVYVYKFDDFEKEAPVYELFGEVLPDFSGNDALLFDDIKQAVIFYDLAQSQRSAQESGFVGFGIREVSE